MVLQVESLEGGAESRGVDPLEDKFWVGVDPELIAVLEVDGDHVGPAPSVVSEEDIAAWEDHEKSRFKKAGKRATVFARRVLDGHHSRPKKSSDDFKGRYAGKCTVSPQLIEVEYGDEVTL